jgi:stage V sporulation protein B
MSRMISQASSLGDYNQVRKTYKVARLFFLGIGLVSSLILVICSPWLAEKMGQPNAALAIACLGPSALFMGLVSTFRGFFQGQGNMAPTSLSQVLEAFIKLVVGFGLALLVTQYYHHIPMAAAGAIIGVTCSCLVSALFLYGKFRPAYKSLPQSQDAANSTKKTALDLLTIAVPITIGSAGLQALTVVEQGLYMHRLLDTLGYAQERADTTKGFYDLATTIYNMPCSLVVPIAISVIPAISSALSLQDHAKVKETEESAARIAGLISLPCTVGLCLLSRPIMALLGGSEYQGENLILAGNLLAVLGLCVFLYAIIQYTNALLQSHGFAYVPVIHMLSAGGAKVGIVYLLSGNPHLGILGAPIGMLLGYTAIASLNLIAIARLVPQKPSLLKNFLRPVLPALAMGGFVALCYRGLLFLGITSRLMLCGAPIAVGVCAYGFGVILFKTIKKEDCLLLPKGEKLAKLLHL